MIKRLISRVFIPVFANDNDAFIPEMWAQEGLMILEKALVTSRLVYTDFSSAIANFGDTINTRRPSVS